MESIHGSEDSGDAIRMFLNSTVAFGNPLIKERLTFSTSMSVSAYLFASAIKI